MRRYPNVLDRSLWGAGPWDDEPDDKITWHDEESGLACMVRRSPVSGAWCGYVGLPPDHPWHGLDYTDESVDAPDVHGGLTFAGPCQDRGDLPICHEPEPGQPDDVWWLGFDCAHAGDLTPFATGPYGFRLPDQTYRDQEWVIGETLHLADLLEEVDADGN